MRRTRAGVEAYISGAPPEVRRKLREVREAILGAAPGAREGISYGIPSYDYKGMLAWFGLSKNHIGLYFRPPLVALHRKELAGYVTTKSAVRLPLDEDIPVSLVKRLVRARMKLNEKEL